MMTASPLAGSFFYPLSVILNEAKDLENQLRFFASLRMTATNRMTAISSINQHRKPYDQPLDTLSGYTFDKPSPVARNVPLSLAIFQHNPSRCDPFYFWFFRLKNCSSGAEFATF
jgi:hypothetical protein